MSESSDFRASPSNSAEQFTRKDKTNLNPNPEYGKWGGLGLPIKVMIYWTDNYVVYLDDKLNIDFRLESLVPETDVSKFNRILNDASSLENLITLEFPDQVRLQCKQLIGDAIACCMDQDYENASQMLVSAAAFVQTRSQEISRMWLLEAAALITAPIALLGCIVWISRNAIAPLIGNTAFSLILCAVAGATGALLSVISRSGNLRFDASSARKLHYVEGFSRVLAGTLSGIIAGIAFKSGFILTNVHNGKRDLVLLLLALAAGGSERFATSIISTVNSMGTKEIEIRPEKNDSTELKPRSRSG